MIGRLLLSALPMPPGEQRESVNTVLPLESLAPHRRKASITVLILAHAVAACSSSLHGDEAEPRFERELTRPAQADDEFATVRLDAEAYSVVGDAFADLRLLDDAHVVVPYWLRRVPAVKTESYRRSWTPRQVTARPLDDDGLEIVVQRAPDDPQPLGLRLVTPLQNFEQRVRVEHSTDGAQWDMLREVAMIFDYARYLDVRNDSFSLPASERRFFRITIDRVTVEQESELLELTRRLRGGDEAERSERVTVDRRPFRIERLEFWRDEVRERPAGDHKTAYPPVRHVISRDADRRVTLVEIETRREPLTSFTLEAAERNFSRRAVVQIPRSPGEDSWSDLSSATLVQIDFKTLQRRELTIPFPESRHPRYRIVLHDGDAPPLHVTRVEAEGNTYELLCLIEPSRQYRLQYGSPSATRPHYDVAPLRELAARFQPVELALGPSRRLSEAASPAGVGWSEWINHPLVLGAVLVVLSVAVGLGLAAAAKRVEALPKEP